MGFLYKSLSGSACALLSQVPHYARRSQRPLCCPASPLPASAQWFAPVGAPLLFITAPLAGAQSELQPGYRAHTEPRRLLALLLPLPPLWAFLPPLLVGHSSSCLLLSLSFSLVWFPHFYFFLLRFFLLWISAAGWISVSVVPRVFTGAFTRCLLLEESPSSGFSYVDFQFLSFGFFFCVNFFFKK